jgi:hypothetical protein
VKTCPLVPRSGRRVSACPVKSFLLLFNRGNLWIDFGPKPFSVINRIPKQSLEPFHNVPGIVLGLVLLKKLPNGIQKKKSFCGLFV